jgi:hypothetical protein
MGDLPGSPSVAPSPLFCTALWGGKGAATGFAMDRALLSLPHGPVVSIEEGEGA